MSYEAGLRQWGWEATDRQGDGYEGVSGGLTLYEALAEAGYELCAAERDVGDVWITFRPAGANYDQRRAVLRATHAPRPGDLPWTTLEWDPGCDPDEPPLPVSPPPPSDFNDDDLPF